MKRLLLLLCVSGVLSFLLAFPGEALELSKAGLMLWFYTLLPSLLPFLILSGFLIHTGFLPPLLVKAKKFWKTCFGLSPMGGYALLMGILCGYPMGAKTTGDLYRNGQISKAEASYLLSFSNYPGPSFVAAYICTELLGNPGLVLPTFGLLYVSGFLSSLPFRLAYKKNSRQNRNKQEFSLYAAEKAPGALPLGEALDASIMNSFTSITKLGGYIILFSVLQGILRRLLAAFPRLCCLVLGFTELSTGISALAQTGLGFSGIYPLILAFTSFGGLCIAFQTKSMLSGTDLSLVPYLKGKALSFFLTLVLACLFIKVIEIVV